MSNKEDIRIKEIKYLKTLKSQLIRETKKEIQNLNIELQTLEGSKTLNRKIKKIRKNNGRG